jgi:arylsulfatase A-like enzyme
VRRLASGVLVGGLAGALAGVVDAVLACARGSFSTVAFPVAIGLLGACGAIAGLVATPGVLALRRAWEPALASRPDIRAFWSTVGAAAIAAAAGFVALGRWSLVAEPPLVLVAAVVVCVVAAGLTVAGPFEALLRGRPRVQIVVVAIVLGLALLLVRGLVAAADTLDLRPFAVLGVFAGAAIGIGVLPRLPRRRAAALALAAFAIAGPLLLATRLDARFIVARHAPLSGVAARALGRVLDLDGDGFNPLFGEGDCAPFDGDIHPFGEEQPGNGRDDDCFAGDLDPAELAQRAASPLPDGLPPEPLHLVLVTIDTLRADRVGAYGYPRETTRTIDGVAQDAVVFERVYSSAPATGRAMPTVLGGLYPSMFSEIHDPESDEIADRRLLFPEILQAAGWRTVAVSSTEILERDNIDQGLDELDLDGVVKKDAADTTTRAVAKLQALADADSAAPFFLWVHYYDPHGPYEAPRQYRQWDDGGKSTAENRSDRYDAEVAYVDDELDRIVRKLRRLGLWDRTIFVVTSDHGEEFMDHGGWYHAEEVYDESLRVPLVVRVPGNDVRRIDAPIGLVDLGPTLVELLGLPAPEGIEGRSQAAAVLGTGAVQEHPIFLEQWKHKTDIVQKIAVVRGHDKLILDLQNQLWELYDLASDPGEQVNRWDVDRRTAAELRELLLGYWQRVRAARALGLPDGAF